MEDKIIMFVENQEINIHYSWNGLGLFKAKLNKFKDDNYLINNLIARKLENNRGENYLLDRFKSQLRFHLDYLKFIKNNHLRTMQDKTQTP